MRLNNQKGFTLLEILVSITILIIVLVSIMPLFSQMGLINAKGEERLQGSNLAKNVLVEWQNDKQVQNALAGTGQLDTIDSYKHEDSQFYYFEKALDSGLFGEIKIKKQSDLNTEPSKAHFILIKILDQNHKEIGKTFGYIFYEVEQPQL